MKLTLKYLDVIIYSEVALLSAYLDDWHEVDSFLKPSLGQLCDGWPEKFK